MVGQHQKGKLRSDCVRFYSLGDREPLNVIWQKSLTLRVVFLKPSDGSVEAQLRRMEGENGGSL